MSSVFFVGAAKLTPNRKLKLNGYHVWDAFIAAASFTEKSDPNITKGQNANPWQLMIRDIGAGHFFQLLRSYTAVTSKLSLVVQC